MKVAQVNSVYGFGSTGIIVKDLDQMLCQHGDTSCVVYQKTNIAVENGFRVGNPVDWKLHALFTRVIGRQGYGSIMATKQMLKYLDIQRPDIVHLHNLHTNYINLNILLRYLEEKNIPTVITLHDCWFFTGKCFHFVISGCDKWKTQCRDCPQNKEDVKSLFFDQSAQVFEDKKKNFQNISSLTVVACSKWMEKLAEQSPIFVGKKITQIYNGVDTEIFRYRSNRTFRKKNKLNNYFVILGMANKWLLHKNSDVFENLLNTLSDDEVIVIIGCSEDQKQRLTVHKKIITMGYINNRDELADIYSSSDVFVNLTFEDTLPTVNMEAICCGTPVITYDSCGSPELVENGKTGYIIPVRSFIDLKASLKKIRTGHFLRYKTEQIGHTNFDKNKQYLRYLEIYNDLKKTRET